MEPTLWNKVTRGYAGSAVNVIGVTMRDKLQNILLKLANDVLDLEKSDKTLGEPIDEATQAILDLLDKSLPDLIFMVKIKTSEGEALVKGNYSRDKLCEMVGYNQALADVRKVIKEEL